ncbi:hypothetical protein [Streptomyces sp. NPDC059016]|uniref:hypothetical protein n=1 Tax=Streptomyces sp. NPDC059016 TaxID=3346699 RepID=UPI0036B2AE6F
MAHIQPALDGSVPPPKKTAARRKVEDFDAWLAEIRPAFERAARTGREFTTWGVADAENLPEPRDPKSQWGRAMTIFKEEGLVETSGWACSDRPATHHSGVRTWRGTRAARRGRAA